MRVLQFTIPVEHDKTVIVQDDCKPHFYQYLHRHKEVQIMWIREGYGTLAVGTSMHPFKPGDVFFIGANQPHVFKSSPEYFLPGSQKEINSTSVFFDPSGKLADVFEIPEFRAIKSFIRQHAVGFKVPDDGIVKVIDKIMAIKDAKAMDRVMEFFELLKLFNKISKSFEPLSKGVLNNVTESEGIRIGDVYNHIMQHYHTDITLDDVSRVAFMTPQAFCRYFKKHTGSTFINFLNEVRVNEACKILTSTEFKSVAAVAYASGFNSITNFNRVFKTIMGNTPLEYIALYKR